MKAKRTSKLKRARTERAKPRSVQRVVSRTDTQILDALEALPCCVDIIYKRGYPRSDSVLPLRDQINHFLDAEASAANAELRYAGESGVEQH